MNIKQFLKWSLVLLAFLAYKRLEAASPDITVSGGVLISANVQRTQSTYE